MASAESLEGGGVYLLENGQDALLYFDKQVRPGPVGVELWRFCMDGFFARCAAGVVLPGLRLSDGPVTADIHPPSV